MSFTYPHGPTPAFQPAAFRKPKRSWLSRETEVAQTLRLMIFYVQERLLGLPLSMVLKVSHCPDGIQINAEGVGLLELRTGLSTQTILVVDLAHVLSNSQAAHPLQDPFLILIQTAQGEPCALPLRIMPALIDVPLAEVTPLPSALQRDPAYRFVSHLATLSNMDPPQRLHILGLGREPLFAEPAIPLLHPEPVSPSS
ncbi:MAG: hypothetical protein SNJ85_06215 [Cyanobacteriota bacterium]